MEDAQNKRCAWLRGLSAKAAVINAATAILCAMLALMFLGQAFVLAELGKSGLWGQMWPVVLVVAILGIGLGAFLKDFPWLAVFLTPLVAVGMLSVANPLLGLVVGLPAGGCAGVVFLLGAAAGRGLRNWRSVRKGGSLAKRSQP